MDTNEMIWVCRVRNWPSNEHYTVCVEAPVDTAVGSAVATEKAEEFGMVISVQPDRRAMVRK